MQKEIIWNNQIWIIDYETRTIYQKAVTPGLPVQARIGNYSFKELKGIIYFQAGNNYYKVSENQIEEINKEEYEEVKNFIRINKKDPATQRRISTYIISIIIDEIMHEKYNLKVSIKVDNQSGTNIVNSFRRKFTPELSVEIKRLTEAMLVLLPCQINSKTIKQQLTRIYKDIEEESAEYLKLLGDNIYLNDQESFDVLSENIKSSRRLKGKEIISEDGSSKAKTGRKLSQNIKNR